MKQLTSLVIILCIGLYTTAQQDGKASSSLLKTTRIDTINKNGKILYQPVNALKFDILKTVIGDITIAYERKVGIKSSIEIELGPTVSNYGLNAMTTNSFSDNMNDSYDSYSYINREGDFGFLASFAFRSYLLNGYPALNGLYVGPKVKFKNYNDIGRLKDPFEAAPEDMMKNQLNQLFIIFDVGMTHWFSPSFGIEYYATFGLTMNFMNYSKFKFDYDPDLDTNNSMQYNTYTVNRTSRRYFNPTFGIGFKASFGM